MEVAIVKKEGLDKPYALWVKGIEAVDENNSSARPANYEKLTGTIIEKTEGF